MDPEDRALVHGLRSGHAAAFGQAHQRFGPRIWSFLSRMCPRRDIAEDIYQETWIKLAVHAPRLLPDTDLPAWLYTVARNLARSERRSARAKPTTGTPSDLVRDTSASPFDWALANETQGLLEQALAELPLPFREVLVLVVVDGVDHERAAAILELSPDALRQRLARARAKLAERHEALARASASARAIQRSGP